MNKTDDEYARIAETVFPEETPVQEPPLSNDELNRIAERAIFDGFLKFSDLIHIMAAEEGYKAVLPTLWRFSILPSFQGKGQFDLETLDLETREDRFLAWKVLLSMWGDLSPFCSLSRHFNLYREQFGKLEVWHWPEEYDFVNLEEYQEFLKDMGQGVNMNLSLPARLYPSEAKTITPTAVTPTETIASENFLQRGGDIWRFRYLRKDVPPIRDSKGIRYIAKLLRNPRKAIHVNELVAFMPIEETEFSNRIGEELEGIGMRKTSKLGDSGEAWDEEDINRLGNNEKVKLLKEVSQQKEKAEREGDFLLKKELREKERVIYNQLMNEMKKSRDVTDNIRKAVSKAIKMALTRIKEKNPALYDHLQKSITTGTTCMYNPPDDISWTVSL